MFPKGKGTPVPSDGQAREKLALYVYEYLLHIGAQKSAQTFYQRYIRWEKNITLGEPPGFLHSWWCVFWDLYCAAPERRETCDHSSEAKAFHDYSAAAAPSPVMGGMPPGEGMPGGPMPPGLFQVIEGLLAKKKKKTCVIIVIKLLFISVVLIVVLNCFNVECFWISCQNFGGGMRPPHNTMGPAMPGVNMGPGTGRPWPNPNNANSVSTNSFTENTPCEMLGASGGGGPPGTPIMPSPAVLIYAFSLLFFFFFFCARQFPMGPGSDGPLGAMAGMEPHHMNGSLGNTTHYNTLDSINREINPPGTPRDDGELSGNFLHSFQSENVSLRSVMKPEAELCRPHSKATVTVC
uniref:Single stranded DNA binding protein 3 n=1 Tax=Salarias fasciatus TaxID=181472 RepID=A0A672I4H8_SALFA